MNSMAIPGEGRVVPSPLMGEGYRVRVIKRPPDLNLGISLRDLVPKASPAIGGIGLTCKGLTNILLSGIAIFSSNWLR